MSTIALRFPGVAISSRRALQIPQANCLYLNDFLPIQIPPCTKVTFPKSGPSRDDGPASGTSIDPKSNHHAAKTDGCPYAWALLPRVLMAAARDRWELLPGLPALRGRVKIRLDYHASNRARGACQA